jgi:hypothetical protein
MNLKKNNKRKELIIDMIKDLVLLQSQSPKYAANKLNYIVNGFIQDTIDFSKGINYIDSNLKNAKNETMKIFWIQVLNLVKKYFEEIK